MNVVDEDFQIKVTYQILYEIILPSIFGYHHFAFKYFESSLALVKTEAAVKGVTEE